MNDVAKDICSNRDARPDFIYYTGRAPELTSLVGELGSIAGCVGVKQPFTILGGDDLTKLDRLPDPNIELYFTTLTFPAAWASECGGSDQPMFIEFRRQYGTEGYDGLISGHAILGYDAVLTMATAAKDAVSDRHLQNRKSFQISAGDVWRELSNGEFKVNGASGVIVPYQSQAADSNNRFIALVRYRSEKVGPEMEHPYGVLSDKCSG